MKFSNQWFLEETYFFTAASLRCNLGHVFTAIIHLRNSRLRLFYVEALF